MGWRCGICEKCFIGYSHLENTSSRENIDCCEKECRIIALLFIITAKNKNKYNFLYFFYYLCVLMHSITLSFSMLNLKIDF